MLAAIFILCLLFQVDDLYEAVEEYLTEQYRDNFDPNTLLLSIAVRAPVLIWAPLPVLTVP